MGNKPMVSVICNAYNHGKYIKDALEGFVMQKTDFPFEVLVHDDASTDNTADIIREYEAKHPDLIKPIYQTENQYSKKQGLVAKIQYGRAEGKYIAFCEGDDYWTDPLKLQKQFDAMEAHPEVDMCAHAADKIDAETLEKIMTLMPIATDGILSLPWIIVGGGGYVATNSLFYRRELLENEPEFRKFMKLDFTLQVHGATRGGILFLSDVMSVYRANVNGSWTSTMVKDSDKYKKHKEKVIELLHIMDKNLDYKYTDAIQEKLVKNQFDDLYENGKASALKKEPYLKFYKNLSLKEQMAVTIRGLINTLRKNEN